MERKLAVIENVLNAIPTAVIVLDQRLSTVYINQSAAEIFHIMSPSRCFGQPPGNVISCINSLLTPEGCGFSEACRQCKLRAALTAAINEGESTAALEVEHNLLLEGAESKRWFMVSITPVKIFKTRYIVLAALDISNIKQAEMQITEEKKRADETLSFLLAALKAADARMHIVDQNYNLIYSDPYCLEIYGDYAGKKCYEYYMERSEPCENCGAAAAIASKKTVVTEKTFPKEGNRIFEVHSTPYITRDGERVAINFKFDITVRKIMGDSLVSANIKLENALRAAEQANRAKSLFLSKVSHEIRTPMNVIVGLSDILNSLDINNIGEIEELKEYSQMIRESAYSLLATINDILDLSRIEADKLVIEKARCNISEFLRSAVTPFTVSAEQKDLRFALTFSGNIPPFVVIDQQRVRQVLVNLLSNALKYTDRGGITVSLDVMTSPSGSGHNSTSRSLWLRFSVKDTGIGIPEEKQKGLFEPFVQIDHPEHLKRGGTGLGLTISKKLVELMGGTIGFESAEGKGSTFYFTIPAELPADREEQIDNVLLSPEEAQKIKVLIVDDSKPNQLVAVKMLRQFGFSQTAGASSGSEALSILKEAANRGIPYDVVLLDEFMGEMSGLKTAELIRRDGTFEDLGLIILSSGLEELDQVTAKNLNITARLVKPVTPLALYKAVSQAVSHKRSKALTTEVKKGEKKEEVLNGTCQKTPLQMNILVAEDKPMNQKLLKILLEKKGHKVTCASDGREALDLYKKHCFDLVIMDVGMPGMDGLQATTEIREWEKNQGRKHTPIVALTAYAMEEDIKKCFEAGMDGYMAKPVKPDELYGLLDSFSTHLDAKCSGPALPCKTSSGAENYQDLTDDLKRLAATIGPDTEQITHILEMFIEDTHAELEKIKKVLKEEDAASTRFIAHGLKGEMCNLGLRRACTLMSEIEGLLKAGQLVPVGQKLQELEEEIHRLERFLQQVDWKNLV